MCPACVAAMGLYVAGGLSAGAGVTFIATRLSRKQRESAGLDSRLRANDTSLVADNFASGLVHLAARDTAFAVVSRAPIGKIEGFRKRMGWEFPWVSSHGTDFNYDFQVTLDEKHAVYNYAPVSSQPPGYPREGEREGLSVFLREGEHIFHTYSTYQRGLDILLNTYNFLDLTPLGRQEEDGIMQWVRHHDRY